MRNAWRYRGFQLKSRAMKVFVYSARAYERQELGKAAAGRHELIFSEARLTRDTVRLAAGCEAISIFTSDEASASILERLHGLGVKYLLLRSVGYDHVDLEKAEELGIRVANSPGSPHAVAEHAVAMLMAVNRKLFRGQQLMQLQDFRISALMGFNIYDKTIGIVGTGKIGLAFARIMLGFGARVVAFDPEVNPEAVKMGVKYLQLEALLRESDVVSLHCPLTPLNRHLMADTQFRWMKRGAIFINTSRGALVNTEDLIRALDTGRLGAACLDVYEFEKGLFFEDHSDSIIHDRHFTRLRSFRNVLITPHQSFLTAEAMLDIARITIANLDSFHNAHPCKNELTKLHASRITHDPILNSISNDSYHQN